MLRFWLKTMSLPSSGRRLAKAAVCILAESLRDENLLYEFELVLTEACANVVKHAYGGGQAGDLEIELRIEPEEYVEFEIADQGLGFGEAAMILATPEPSAESGRGLYIIARLADAMEIRTRGGRNIVFFRKNIGKEAWKISS